MCKHMRHCKEHVIRQYALNIHSGRLLDLACGKGQDLEWLAQLGVSDITGVDVDLPALCYYYTKYIQHVDRGHLQHVRQIQALSLHQVDINEPASLEELIAAGPFENVVCQFAVHHFTPAAIGQIHRLLVAGGRLILSYMDRELVKSTLGRLASSEWGNVNGNWKYKCVLENETHQVQIKLPFTQGLQTEVAYTKAELVRLVGAALELESEVNFREIKPKTLLQVGDEDHVGMYNGLVFVKKG
jgi:2-polyprenyl-3-methyl-5-hydroxy-6-metoxy-1,4-benzoquinol methylase